MLAILFQFHLVLTPTPSPSTAEDLTKYERLSFLTSRWTQRISEAKEALKRLNNLKRKSPQESCQKNVEEALATAKQTGSAEKLFQNYDLRLKGKGGVAKIGIFFSMKSADAVSSFADYILLQQLPKNWIASYAKQGLQLFDGQCGYFLGPYSLPDALGTPYPQFPK